MSGRTTNWMVQLSTSSPSSPCHCVAVAISSSVGTRYPFFAHATNATTQSGVIRFHCSPLWHCCRRWNCFCWQWARSLVPLRARCNVGNGCCLRWSKFANLRTFRLSTRVNGKIVDTNATSYILESLHCMVSCSWHASCEYRKRGTICILRKYKPHCVDCLSHREKYIYLSLYHCVV